MLIIKYYLSGRNNQQELFGHDIKVSIIKFSLQKLYVKKIHGISDYFQSQTSKKTLMIN